MSYDFKSPTMTQINEIKRNRLPNFFYAFPMSTANLHSSHQTKLTLTVALTLTDTVMQTNKTKLTITVTLTLTNSNGNILMCISLTPIKRLQ